MGMTDLIEVFRGDLADFYFGCRTDVLVKDVKVTPDCVVNLLVEVRDGALGLSSAHISPEKEKGLKRGGFGGSTRG